MMSRLFVTMARGHEQASIRVLSHVASTKRDCYHSGIKSGKGNSNVYFDLSQSQARSKQFVQ